MAKVKTTFTEESVIDFVEAIDNEQKKKDSYALIALMEKASGEPARMFGPTIIGFGKYHYKYASSHEGVAPLLGFSPRKAAISLYVYAGCDGQDLELANLGKFKMAKACIYIKKLSDIDIPVLEKIMQEGIDFISERYERLPAE